MADDVSSAAAPLLLLFDIDGTLLSGATAAHSEALREAVRQVHGVDTGDRRASIDMPGRTDGEIARLLLMHAGGLSRLDSRFSRTRRHKRSRLPPQLRPRLRRLNRKSAIRAVR